MQKRRFNRHSSESGFTLVELLVVVAIIGILSVLGLQSIDKLRESLYKAANTGLTRDAFTSLQAGQIDADDFGTDRYEAQWVRGTVVSSDGDTTAWAPGVDGSAAGNVSLYIMVNNLVSESNLPNSYKYYVVARQCGGRVARAFYETGSGLQGELNYYDNDPC